MLPAVACTRRRGVFSLRPWPSVLSKWPSSRSRPAGGIWAAAVVAYALLGLRGLVEKHDFLPHAAARHPGVLALLGLGAGWMAWRHQGATPPPTTDTVASAPAAVPSAPAPEASSPAHGRLVAEPASTAVKEPFSITAALEGIVRGADPLLAVNTITDKSQLVIGKDKLLFQVKSSEPGYLYVYLAGTDQSHLYLLFPNALDKNNRIEANKLIELPRKGWHITAGGPPGVDHVVTVVSPLPRDLGVLGLKPGDTIPEVDMAKVKALWEAHDGPGSPFVGTARCDGQSAPCDQRYGASLVHIEEVQR